MLIRGSGVLVALVLVQGCAGDGSTAPEVTPRDPVPGVTGIYAGRYEVPASADLAAAATFSVEHVHWTVADGVAVLDYDLPIGLVGGKLSITLSGRIDPGATLVTLASEDGSGTCVAAATRITCNEQFANLGLLPIDMMIVEQMAAVEYPGPLAHRVEVVRLFSSDPIGILDFDTQFPIVDDKGGGQ